MYIDTFFKPYTLRSRQGLSFQADTPNFMKILLAQNTKTSSSPTTTSLDDKDPQDDSRHHDDEKPQLVLGKNVTQDDANVVIGKLKDSSGRGMSTFFFLNSVHSYF